MSQITALTHSPSANMEACQRTFVPRLSIDYDKAVRQHAAYCEALRDCGCQVRILDVNCRFPDCAFIEDTAVVLDELAVLCSMGAESRGAEPVHIEPLLREFREVQRIEPPATFEGGDVLRVGRTLLVGESPRTNAAGIDAFTAIVKRFGYSVVSVPLGRALHLKTACTALPDGRLLVNPAWIDERSLAGFPIVHVPEAEPWAANVVLIGDTVVMPAAAVQTRERLHRLGFTVKTVDLSEFAKAEAGVTCLALLVPAYSPTQTSP